MRIDDAGARTWLLAALAGWALLAWMLTIFGMARDVAPLREDPSMLRPLPELPSAPGGRLGPAAQYGELAARPLFAADRQPRPFAIAGLETGAGDTAFDYVLTSVLITPGLKMAILQPADGSDPVRVRLDEAPEAHPAWRLSTLAERSAVFEGPDGQRSLELRVYDGQGGQAPTAVAVDPATSSRRNGNVLPIQPPRAQPAPPQRGMAPTGQTSPASPEQPPAAPPDVTEEPSPSDAGPMTNEAQMEAIRKRIEARRAQLRQQATQPPQPTQPPAQSP